MIWPIVVAPHEMLKSLSALVPEGAYITDVVQDMVDTAMHHNAEGLAACQIGAPVAVIIVAVNTEKPRQYVCLVNPVITARSGLLHTALEGCLCIPGKKHTVPRPLEITVDYRAFPNGNFNQQKLDGRLSRVVQHEIDHLNGILITDRAVTVQ